MSECQEAAEIASSQFLKGVLIFKVVFSIIGAVVPALLLYFKGLRWLIHPNAKVLFSLHLLWTITVCVCNTAVFIYDYWRISRPVSSPCDIMITVGFCMATKMFTVFGIVCEETSMFAFAVERAFSTLYPAKYEKIKSCQFSIWLGIASMLLCAGMKYGFMLLGLDFSDLTPSYTVIFPGNSDYFQISLHLEIALEVATGVIFAAAYIRNRQLRKRHVFDASVLATKYQVSENQKLIVLLFPLFVLHFVINVFTVGILAAYPYVGDFTGFYTEGSLSRLVWTEFWSTPYLYAILFPLLVYYRLRKEEERRKSDPAGFVQTEQQHFNQLAILFNK